MTAPIFISPRVLNTINSLPMEDRIAVATAITGEMLLGGDASGELTPMQQLVYTIIRQYVRHDTNTVTPAC